MDNLLNQNEDIREYAKEKIKVLKQLGINLNSSQKKHLYELKTEIDIDNYAHDLIFN